MHLPFSSHRFNNLLFLLEHICHIYKCYLSAYLSKNSAMVFCCCCSTMSNISCSVAIDWLFSLLMLESSCLFGHFILDYRRCECMHDIANPTGILCLFDSLLEEIILFLFFFSSVDIQLSLYHLLRWHSFSPWFYSTLL